MSEGLGNVGNYIFWRSRNEANAADAIVTGAKTLADLVPDERLVELCGEGSSALDIGCGAGRNTVPLASNFTHVVGFDLPNMIDIARERGVPDNVELTSEWDRVMQGRYDVVLACLFLQHLTEGDVRTALTSLRTRADTFVIASRTWLDFGHGELLPILEELLTVDFFEPTYRDDQTGLGDHYIAMCSTET